jgi:hypothetical protein
MAPGHPFVDALAAALEEESRKVLLRGTVLHDARSEAPYLLVLLQYGIRSVGFGEEVDAVTLDQRLSCLKVSPSGEVSAAAPQAFTALSTRGESSHEVPAVDETERAVDLALAHVKEQLVPTLKAEAVSRVENQRRAELLEARRRLEAEIRRLDSKAARLAQRSSDAHELQRVNERVEELERRRAERESEMREEVRLEATEPKLIALAAVVPGGEPGFEARLAQAKRAVARSLQIAGRVDDALPLSGYDFMFTPSDLGQAPRLVSVRIGVDDEEAVASDAEKLVASNVGDAYYIALADEQRTVRWRGDRNPVPTA